MKKETHVALRKATQNCQIHTALSMEHSTLFNQVLKSIHVLFFELTNIFIILTKMFHFSELKIHLVLQFMGCILSMWLTF